MDSTIYTVEMQGLGGGNTQYLFLLLGFATDTTEPTHGGTRLPLLGCG